jgi:HSP20 family protein
MAEDEKPKRGILIRRPFRHGYPLLDPDPLFGSWIGRLFEGWPPMPRWAQMTDYRNPLSDIKYSNTGLTAEIEVPGVKPEDIDITVTDSALEIIAKRDEAKEESKKGEVNYRYERTHVGFQRSFPLYGEVNLETAVANYENGILKLELSYVKPLNEEPETKKIPVKGH